MVHSVAQYIDNEKQDEKPVAVYIYILEFWVDVQCEIA